MGSRVCWTVRSARPPATETTTRRRLVEELPTLDERVDQARAVVADAAGEGPGTARHRARPRRVPVEPARDSRARRRFCSTAASCAATTRARSPSSAPARPPRRGASARAASPSKLTADGVTVISGLARGIDSEAHARDARRRRAHDRRRRHRHPSHLPEGECRAGRSDRRERCRRFAVLARRSTDALQLPDAQRGHVRHQPGHRGDRSERDIRREDAGADRAGAGQARVPDGLAGHARRVGAAVPRARRDRGTRGRRHRCAGCARPSRSSSSPRSATNSRSNSRSPPRDRSQQARPSAGGLRRLRRMRLPRHRQRPDLLRLRQRAHRAAAAARCEVCGPGAPRRRRMRQPGLPLRRSLLHARSGRSRCARARCAPRSPATSTTAKWGWAAIFGRILVGFLGEHRAVFGALRPDHAQPDLHRLRLSSAPSITLDGSSKPRRSRADRLAVRYDVITKTAATEPMVGHTWRDRKTIAEGQLRTALSVPDPRPSPASAS